MKTTLGLKREDVDALTRLNEELFKDSNAENEELVSLREHRVFATEAQGLENRELEQVKGNVLAVGAEFTASEAMYEEWDHATAHFKICGFNPYIEEVRLHGDVFPRPFA